MEIIQAISAIFTVIGIPSLFFIVFYLHNKHVAMLQDRIRLLEERSPEKLATVLKSQSKLYEAKLSAQEREYRIGLEEERERAEALEKDLEALRTSMEIMDKYWAGDDYRYEILREQQRERKQTHTGDS